VEVVRPVEVGGDECHEVRSGDHVRLVYSSADGGTVDFGWLPLALGAGGSKDATGENGAVIPMYSARGVGKADDLRVAVSLGQPGESVTLLSDKVLSVEERMAKKQQQQQQAKSQA
jgi:hypothetical protein